MISYIEIIKYLNKEEYVKNPPEFNNLLMKFEMFNPAFNQDDFLGENKNAKLFLSYLFVKFNWVMHNVAIGNPDLSELTNLIIQVESIREKFSSDMVNHYINMLYMLMSSISLYYTDKSTEALVEFNRVVADVLKRSAEWWTHDYNYEYMKSKAPQKILDMKVKSACSACSCSDNLSKSCKCEDTNA